MKASWTGDINFLIKKIIRQTGKTGYALELYEYTQTPQSERERHLEQLEAETNARFAALRANEVR